MPGAVTTAAGLVLVMAVGLAHSLPLLSAQSSIRDAVVFLTRQGARKIVVPNEEFAATAYNFYGANFEAAQANTLADAQALARSGYPWLVLDRGAGNSHFSGIHARSILSCRYWSSWTRRF